jgi:hypothetical protein
MKEIKTINWKSSKGQNIELRAYCKVTMAERKINLDGDIIKGKAEPSTDANLELWVDGVKVDSCWDTNFWTLIDVRQMPGVKKVWGLKVAMGNEQAAIVDRFLKDVIENGKQEEVKAHEAAEAEAGKVENIKMAEAILAKAEKTYKNADGTLMDRKQANVWMNQYNDINNEGGEGYVPEIITAEDVEWARSIISK